MPDRRLIDGQFAVGDPIWFDLVTDDVQAAERFYGRVFGWSFTAAGEPRGDGDAERPAGYRVAMIGERSVAGIGRLGTGSDRTSGWWLHLTAPNVKALAKQVEELGGSADEPIEAAGIAEMAVARDPQGAAFGLWRPDPLRGHAPTDTPGTVHWAELHTPDPLAVAPFYEDLFESKHSEARSGALNLQRTELGQPRMVAGMQASSDGSGAASGRGGSAEDPHWRLYFLVDDVARCGKAAEESGGAVIDDLRDASDRRVLVLRDPQGAEFGVVQRGTGSRD